MRCGPQYASISVWRRSGKPLSRRGPAVAMWMITRRLLGLSLLLGVGANAQESVEQPIHWAYGAYFGTGRYEIDSGEAINVLSIQPRWQVREASFDRETGRTIGFAARISLAIGGHHFDVADIGSTLRTENVSTVSAVPGIELDIPLTARWSVKPFVYAGWGTAVGGEDSAWIYWAGLKSEVRFPSRTIDWALVNALTVVGYASDAGARDEVVPFFTGLEIGHPVSAWTIDDEAVHLHWRVGYTKYIDELELGPVRSGLATAQIRDEWEIGVALGKERESLKLWRLRWDRIGIVYRFSREDGYTGVGLTFRSFFDQ